MSSASKETLYIEADEEITTIIDKVVSSKHKVVATVLPKHAAVFQSAVNMKLVKKAADDANKNLVLITSDPSVKLIAGVSGVHIAKSLTSKPEIPKKPKAQKNETTISADEKIVDEPELSPEDARSTDKEETIELDNTETDGKSAKKTVGKKLKFKIPDFSSFRLKMGLVISAIILLVVGWFFGFVVLPEATITINTDTNKSDVSTDFIVKDGLEQADFENGVLPAIKVEVDKEDSVTVPATGEKDVGEKASGIMTLTNCIQSFSGVDVPAGSAFSVGSYTFVTTEAIELSPAVYVGDECRSADAPELSPGVIKDTTVVATQPGTGYNLDARAYTSSISGVSAYGSDMSGGTTQLVKVVSEEDIKNATDQLTGSSTADAVDELKGTLNDQQLQPLVETLNESDAKVVRSAPADTEVSELTVTRSVKYSMSGVSSDYLSQLLDNKIKEGLTDETQNIRSNGLDSAVFSLIAKVSDTEHQLSVRTVATIGPEFDEVAIKQEVAGKKRGDIEKLLEVKDGVRSVSVEFSPFWIFEAPEKPDKITLIINEL